MPCISFATGSEPADYTAIGYVAKDHRNMRECHVFECGDLASDVMATIGQAFELRYKAFLAKGQANTRAQFGGGGMPGAAAIYGDGGGGGGPIYDQAAGELASKREREVLRDGSVWRLI